MYALLTLESQVFAVFGVIIYEKFLKNTEVRSIIFANVILGIVLCFLFYAQSMRWNLSWHINDLAFLIVLFALQGAVQMAFQALPILALFVKITPRKIEGTIYALMTSTWNLDQSVLQPAIGAAVNAEFVGVTQDDQSGYPTLMFIQLLTSPLGFSLLPFIPLSKQIKRSKRLRLK